MSEEVLPSKETENALVVLGQQYKNVMERADSWGFFRELAGYTKTLQEISQTSPLITAIEAERANHLKLIETMNLGAGRELAEAARQIGSLADKVALPHQALTDAIEQIQKPFSQSLVAFQKVQQVNSNLAELAEKISNSGVSEIIKKYQDANSVFRSFTFSPAYEELQKEVKKVERQAELEPWGAWEHLAIAERLVLEPEKIQDEVRSEAVENPAMQSFAFNFFGVAGEMERIRTGELADDVIVYFKVKDFKDYTRRIHDHVTKQLLTPSKENKELDFNHDESILAFTGEKITISKRAQSDAHDLLYTIFKEKAKTWHTDEVLDDWKVDTGDRVPKNKVYHAGKAVNRIIAEQTTIKDFLIVTTKKVSINAKYLNS